MTREELDALHGRSGEAMACLYRLSGRPGDTDVIARFIADARRLLSDLMLKELDVLEADLRSGNPNAQIRAAAGIARMFSPPSDAEIELSDQDLQEMINRLRLGETVSISYHLSNEGEDKMLGRPKDEIEATLNDPEKRAKALVELANAEGADVLVIDTIGSDEEGEADDDAV